MLCSAGVNSTGGLQADGRMVYVGMIYNPQPRAAAEECLSKPCDGARYLAGLYTLEDLGVQPDEIYFMTRKDILEGNADLIDMAAKFLSSPASPS